LANHHLYIFFMASNCDNEFQLATSSLWKAFWVIRKVLCWEI
jgi:hypothetical protein